MSAEYAVAFDPVEYPYYNTKIPITYGADGFREFTESFPGFSFCPYVADKDLGEWDRSTSRVYMNQVLPRFLYVPVTVPGGANQELSKLFEVAERDASVLAVNITQPHKSSPVLRAMYLGDAGSDENVDTLIRGEDGLLMPYDLNSDAFVGWFKDSVSEFRGKSVLLVGVGGVGEPIAKKIAAEHPAELLLVDVHDKHAFARNLHEDNGVPVRFATSISELLPNPIPAGQIIINAAGKEAARDDSELAKVLVPGVQDGIFVDIRPHLRVAVVEQAKVNGWRAYTGHVMNARNDYVLLQGIARQIPGAQIPTFTAFQKLVAAAS